MQHSVGSTDLQRYATNARGWAEEPGSHPDTTERSGPLLGNLREGGVVDLVSASVGAGHHAAAQAIAAQFEEHGHPTRIWDVLELMPAGVGQLIQTTYLRQVQLAPSSYRWMLRGSQTGRWDWLMHQGLRSIHRQLLQIAADRPMVMISTHPFASQALGELRARGLLDIPVVTYLTDMSVHRAWVHASIDLHLTLHALAAEDARRAGAGQIAVVRPAVRTGADGSSPRSRRAARQALALPQHGRLVLVTGGSEGLGDLERTAKDILAEGAGTPVVLCGRNDRLLRRLAAEESVVSFGWFDDLPRLLRAVDCVVQNAGGMMSLEAMAAGVPVLSYRCISGHGEANARLLDQAGFAPWIRSCRQLGRAIATATAPAALVDPAWSQPTGWPSVVEAVTGSR